MAGKDSVNIPYSKMKDAMADVLKRHVFKKRGLAYAGLSYDIHMLASVFLLNAKDPLIPAEIAFADIGHS